MICSTWTVHVLSSRLMSAHSRPAMGVTSPISTRTQLGVSSTTTCHTRLTVTQSLRWTCRRRMSGLYGRAAGAAAMCAPAAAAHAPAAGRRPPRGSGSASTCSARSRRRAPARARPAARRAAAATARAPAARARQGLAARPARRRRLVPCARSARGAALARPGPRYSLALASFHPGPWPAHPGLQPRLFLPHRAHLLRAVRRSCGQQRCVIGTSSPSWKGRLPSSAEPAPAGLGSRRLYMLSMTSARVRPVVAADARSSRSTCAALAVAVLALCEPASPGASAGGAGGAGEARGAAPRRLAARPASYGGASTPRTLAPPPQPCLQTRCAGSSPCGTASMPARPPSCDAVQQGPSARELEHHLPLGAPADT